MTNQSAYRHPKVAEAYAVAAELYPAEKVVLNLLADELSDLRMLDLGIGGGRTTEHFAPQVKEYVGVDYSPEMIAACRKRFPEWAHHGAFRVCDARAMPMFPDGYFDFVLFSFNGIDYVSHEDRERILGEVARVSRDGGVFVFSTHNLNSDVPAKFGAEAGTGLAIAVKQRLGAALFRVLNPHWYRRGEKDFLVINDGAHRFRLRTYYVRPGAQIRQLVSAGFRDVKIFASNGSILTPQAAEKATDPWLYYMARVQRRA